MRMSSERTSANHDQATGLAVNNDNYGSESSTQPISSPDGSGTSTNEDINVVEFGPIKVKQRKKPAPTLATGRRSRYELLTPEEEEKREIRRARNRAAAERVRLNRLGIQEDLQGQINNLERERQLLVTQVQKLHAQKFDLEARLQTHHYACPTSTFSTSISSNLTMSFINDNFPTSTTTEQVDKFADLHLNDDSFDSYPILQTPQNPCNEASTTSMTSDYDLDPILMDP